MPTPTYTPNDAIALAQSFGHGVPVAAVQSQVCDVINSMMWTFYPWSWTIATLTPLTCADGTQDYTLNANDTSQMLRPLTFRLVRTDVTPNEYRELELKANLPVELTRKGGLETITSCGYFASSNFVRLNYAASVGTGQTLQIQGFYQLAPTKITSSNMGTAFAFPDYYFSVFMEGLKWKIYQLSDDPRAGAMQYAKNGSMTRQYTGQLGAFMDALLQMARTEDLQAGDEFEFPSQPIGVGRNYWPGLYGV